MIESNDPNQEHSNEVEDWAAYAYRAALEVFARDGWADPEMDVYDTYDAHRPRP